MYLERYGHFCSSLKYLSITAGVHAQVHRTRSLDRSEQSSKN